MREDRPLRNGEVEDGALRRVTQVQSMLAVTEGSVTRSQAPEQHWEEVVQTFKTATSQPPEQH